MARPLSEDKRTAIIEAATEAVAVLGVSSPTAKIARGAGVAEGTLFTGGMRSRPYGGHRKEAEILTQSRRNHMRYKLLGNSGLRVSELCLGTMTFGEDWGWGSSQEESRKVYDTFLEAGGNFFDTANVYTNGTSERLLGEFIQGQRERIVLATKYTNAAPGTDPNAAGNHRLCFGTMTFGDGRGLFKGISAVGQAGADELVSRSFCSLQ